MSRSLRKCLDNDVRQTYDIARKVSNHPPAESTTVERSEKFKDSFQHSIDNILDKSPVIRMNSIRKLTNIMIHNYLPSDFLNNCSNQLFNQIKRLLRNGSKPMEKELASIMLPVLLLQSPSSFNFDGNNHQKKKQLQYTPVPNEIENLNKDLSALLLAIIKNTTNSCDIREKCSIAITMVKFVDSLSEDNDGIFELIQTFEKVIIQIINNNNNNQNDIESDSSLSSQSSEVLHLNENEYLLISTVLNCWAILFTLISPINNNILTTNSIELFIKLLECSNLNVRVTAGKIIALLFEIFAVKLDVDENGEHYSDSILTEYLPEIIEIFEELASNKNKYRTKRDLNKQHKVFRDIKQFLSDGIYRKTVAINYGPEVSLDYGREFVKINSWFLHFRYGFLCKSIGSGITVHLMSGNQFVRDILELNDIYEYSELFFNTNLQRYRRAVKIERNFGRTEDRNMKYSFGCE